MTIEFTRPDGSQETLTEVVAWRLGNGVLVAFLMGRAERRVGAVQSLRVYPDGAVQTECSWCERYFNRSPRVLVLGSRAPEKLSHGICPDCEPIWLREGR